MIQENSTSSDITAPPRGGPWRSFLGRALFEAGLIVFSLLVALWLSDMQERRGIEADVAATREALIAEMRANREILLSEYHLGHQQTLMGSIAQTLEDSHSLDELREGALTAYQMGPHLPELHDAAWRAASSTGMLQHMDREEVFAISTVYSAQDAQTRLTTAYYPHLLQLATYQGEAVQLRGALTGVATFLGDLTASEQMIAARQAQALEAMGESPDAPTEAPLVTQEY